MKFPARKIRRIIIAGVLFILFIYANFYTVRRTLRYGMEVYFYDKMLVAYRVGGMRGLEGELESVFKTDKNPHEREVAAHFKSSIGSIQDPEGFLEKKVNGEKRKMHRMRTMRDAAFAVIVAFLLLRIVLDRVERRK